MKKYIFTFTLFCAMLQFSFAQTQSQLLFSFEDGWKIENFDLVNKVELQTTRADRQDITWKFERIKKMEDDLVQFSMDQKSGKIFLHLALDKQPSWTVKEWVPYLNRRSLLIL